MAATREEHDRGKWVHMATKVGVDDKEQLSKKAQGTASSTWYACLPTGRRASRCVGNRNLLTHDPGDNRN